MKLNNWVVLPNDDGIRPAGNPNECFYCRSAVGEDHKTDCVIRKRTVVVEVTVQLVIDVPEDWNSEQIEFHRNESSWCASNWESDFVKLFEHITKEDSKMCGCEIFETKYLREATEEDEELWGVKISRKEKLLPTQEDVEEKI